MKNLLKGQIPSKFHLDYNLTFSEQSEVVYKKLIPELKRLMKSHFKPSVTQLSNWLHAYHKHRRVRLRKRQSGNLDKEDRRLHKNARLAEVFHSNSLFIYLYYLNFI